MKHLRINKHTEEFETKISKDISFLRRARNRFIRWWVPISGATFLVGSIGLSIATGNVVGLTGIVNEALYNAMSYIVGTALAHGAARMLVFRKLTKRAKHENAIYKANKKSKKHFKKYNKIKDNHHDLTMMAKNIVKRMESSNEANKKSLAREYKRVRRRIDKYNIKIANTVMGIEGALTGRRNGPVARTLALFSGPLSVLTRRTRGLYSANSKYNESAEKMRKTKKEKRSAFGKFIYEGNRIEAERRLSLSHKHLKKIASNTKSIDADAQKLTGKAYKPGMNFLQSLYRKSRYFTADPVILTEKISERKTNYSEELHIEACKATVEGRQMSEPSTAAKSKTTNQRKSASKKKTTQKTANKKISSSKTSSKKTSIGIGKGAGSKQHAYSEPNKTEAKETEFKQTSTKAKITANVMVKEEKEEEKQVSEGKTL